MQIYVTKWLIILFKISENYPFLINNEEWEEFVHFPANFN